MKILQVLDSYPPDLNGGAYFTHRLSRQLSRMGHDVLVICPSRSYKSHYCEYESVNLFRVRSFPVFLYKDFRICLPLWIEKTISKVINDFAPDIVHLQGKFILGDICMKISVKNNFPIVATNHFMPENFFHYTHLPNSLKNMFSKIAWAWIKEMFDKAQIWTTPTETAANLLRINGFDRNINVISCGVDTSRFKPRERAFELNTLKNYKNVPVILYTGRLDQEKNIPVIIDAFNQVLKKIPCCLIIVGVGAEQENLKKYVHKLGIDENVIFPGYLSDEDYPQIFSVADCFIHAGTAELQSIATLEAIASGLPVVAANAVALPELVHHGINGFLFEPNDTDKAASYLYTILIDPELRKKMAIESLRIAAGHDLSLTGKKFIDLYKEIKCYD